MPSAMSVNAATRRRTVRTDAEVAGAGRLLGEDPVAERRPPSDDEQQQQRGPGHEPEPAQLDQDEDHDLAEGVPVVGRVDDDEAGHAHRGRRGEQRVERVGPGAVRRGDREREDDRPDARSGRGSPMRERDAQDVGAAGGRPGARRRRTIAARSAPAPRGAPGPCWAPPAESSGGRVAPSPHSGDAAPRE